MVFQNETLHIWGNADGPGTAPRPTGTPGWGKEWTRTENGAVSRPPGGGSGYRALLETTVRRRHPARRPGKEPAVPLPWFAHGRRLKPQPCPLEAESRNPIDPGTGRPGGRIQKIRSLPLQSGFGKGDGGEDTIHPIRLRAEPPVRNHLPGSLPFPSLCKGCSDSPVVHLLAETFHVCPLSRWSLCLRRSFLFTLS